MVAQNHCILWRRNSQTEEIIEQTLDGMARLGQLNDNSLASAMRKFPRRVFFLSPSWVMQNTTVPSSLQLLSGRGGQAGYNEALATRKKFSDTKCRTLARQRMSKKSSQALGPHGRGSKPIKAKSLQKLRKEVGTVGGQRHCGNGSTEQVVERKVRSMQRWKDKNGNWPSRRLAAKKWQVSGDLWARAKEEALCEGHA